MNELDKRFAELVRQKQRCERCLRTGQSYECSHVVTRKVKSLRWDILNALCLCVDCHRWWHANPKRAKQWFIEKFEVRQDYLNWMQKEPIKPDIDKIKEAIEAKDVRHLTNMEKYIKILISDK